MLFRSGAVLRIANADVLPFDWRAQAKEFLETIARYQKGAGDHFDLGPARREAMALKRDLDAFHAKLAARKLRKDKANRVIMKLARILVPINYTRGPRFRHDPATPIPALPTISIAGELSNHDPRTLGFAKTQAMRGQNRLVAALREARELIASA